MIRKKLKTVSIFISAMMVSTMVPQSIRTKAEFNNGFEDISMLSEVVDDEELIWNFNDLESGLSGWDYGGLWDYAGDTIQLNYDESIGNGSLKLTVDYSKNVGTSWSEVKIANNLSKAINFSGYNSVTYDLIYNSKNMTTGTFKSKLFIDNVVDQYVDINLNESEEIGNDLRKVQVKIDFNSKNVDINNIIIGIIGANTDYSGDLYIDNIRFDKMKQDEVYVEKTSIVQEQQVVDISTLSMESSVKLVDGASIESTADLYSYLKALGKSDKVLYGHQNDTHHKAVLKNEGTNSDTKDLTGSISAIVGIDTLSLTGAELQLSEDEANSGLTLHAKAAQIGIDAATEGGIITLSAHMPNFALVAEKGVNENGEYDYSGYSPGVTTGDIVTRIMPGGDLNEVYTGYLDLISEYANILEENNVPVLFRPFHENNGSWFWWGKAYCDEEAYKNLFKYTVEYLRDTKEVHNFLYVYSPNGPFENKGDYLSRYPGDEFIDIIAFDMYHDNPMDDPSQDPWMETLRETVQLVEELAEERGKVAAVSETGIRINYGCLPVTGNVNKQWFQDVSEIISQYNIPYYMVWANFDEENMFAPYMVDENRGHEMINDFIDYYNNNQSVFADGVGHYFEASTSIEEAYSYGYITSPASRSRVLEPTTITASVKNIDGDVFFKIKNKDGEEIATLKAIEDNGLLKADITKDLLDTISETIGTIELYCEDKLLNSINIIFNIEEQLYSKELVDDFESYYGEDELLKNKWATNAGSGCLVNPTLTSKEGQYYEGNYGLAFNYKISNDKTAEGWAGITKTVGVDWSEYDALQLWIKPDGKGQKLVVQVTTNGEDFEVIMPEFAATTEPKLLTLKFSDFVGKNGGIIDLTNVERIGIWCNTLPQEGYEGEWTVESTMYFDSIKAVDTTKIEDNNNDENKDDDDHEGGNDDKKDETPIIDNNENAQGNNGQNSNEQNNNEQVKSEQSSIKKTVSNKVPNTGGINSLYVICLGSLLTISGVCLKRKKK